MTYNPKTHLLRPLEPGEVIEADDVFATFPVGEMEQATISIGKPFTGKSYAFRPVPITTGWRPRSEAHLLKDLPPKAKALWRNIDSLYGDMVFNASTETGAGWTAFLIIPPCDLPPPDPERERFEAFIKDSFNGLPDKEQYAGTKEAFWKVWQAAARKETP